MKKLSLTKEIMQKAIDNGCDTQKALKYEFGISQPTVVKYLKLYNLWDYLLAKKRLRTWRRIAHGYKQPPPRWAMMIEESQRLISSHSPLSLHSIS